jgi:hypothetical protein
MRIKVTGTMTAKALGLLLLKTMAEQGITEVNGANLYVGEDDRLVKVTGAKDG